VRSIDPALLRRYHDNDPGLVAEVLLAAPLHPRNRLTVDWEGAWVLDADPIPGWPGRPVTVRVELVAAIPVRPLRLVADGLGISRAAAQRLRADGRIRSRPAWTPAPAAASPSRSTIRGPAEVSRYGRPADGRNSWLEGAERAGWPGRRLWARVASVRRSLVRRSRSGMPVLAVVASRRHHSRSPWILDTTTPWALAHRASRTPSIRQRRVRSPGPRAVIRLQT
jgi:hypothetical protein